jgi:putative DNA methylase
VVMLDHIHMVFTPLEGQRLSTIMNRVKGASSHLINRAVGRHGRLWQDESFDRIVRASENLRKKCDYVISNPVRVRPRSIA